MLIGVLAAIGGLVALFGLCDVSDFLLIRGKAAAARLAADTRFSCLRPGARRSQTQTGISPTAAKPAPMSPRAAAAQIDLLWSPVTVRQLDLAADLNGG